MTLEDLIGMVKRSCPNAVRLEVAMKAEQDGDGNWVHRYSASGSVGNSFFADSAGSPEGLVRKLEINSQPNTGADPV
jgi:hypothetical protein